MFKHLIYKLGSDPHKNWSNFKLGLMLFALGALLILTGAKSWMYFQIPGIVLLAIGLLISLRAWLGLLANRFSQTLNRLAVAADKDSKNSSPD